MVEGFGLSRPEPAVVAVAGAGVRRNEDVVVADLEGVAGGSGGAFHNVWF